MSRASERIRRNIARKKLLLQQVLEGKRILTPAERRKLGSELTRRALKILRSPDAE